MAKTKSKIQSIQCNALRVTDTLTVNGTTDLGTVTWSGAQTFNGALTINTTTTIIGALRLTNATLPTSATATGVAGTFVLRPSNGTIVVCMSTNTWYAITLTAYVV